MVQVCDGSELPKGDKSKAYLLRKLRRHGARESGRDRSGEAAMLTTVVSKLKGTHKSWWSATPHRVSRFGREGWRRGAIQIYDLSDPAKPAFIRNFGSPGTSRARAVPCRARCTDHFDRAKPIECISPTGRTARVLQIVDREKLLNGPKEPRPRTSSIRKSRTSTPPQFGAHTSFPVLGLEIADSQRTRDARVRDFVVVTGETFRNECQEARQMVVFVDVTDETRPVGVSSGPSREKRRLLQPRRALRHALLERELRSRVLQAHHVLAHFNAGVARTRHP